MKNLLKSLVTATTPAALAASVVAIPATPAQNPALCDITGGHLTSAHPVPQPASPPFPGFVPDTIPRVPAQAIHGMRG